jgi:hypothetical protein
MDKRSAALLVASLAGCAIMNRASAPAAKPLEPFELASHNLTVTCIDIEPAICKQFSAALAKEGFKLVTHPPFHEDLEVSLTAGSPGEGSFAIAKLRSDGFTVADEQAPISGGDSTAVQLAHQLAISQGIADFVRNSGTPQQTPPSAP